MEARTVLVGRTEEGLLCDPGSLLRQEGGKKRRAKIIYFEVLGGKTSYLNTTTTTVSTVNNFQNSQIWKYWEGSCPRTTALIRMDVLPSQSYDSRLLKLRIT